MKMEPLQNGCLKIWLTETDMQHWGLQFDHMNAQDEATKRAILKLIALAYDRHVLHTTYDLTVEALPLAEGCLLLLSPTAPPKRVPVPTVYAFNDADALLQFSHALTGVSESDFPPTSLYVFDNQYRLIVYAGFDPSRSVRRLLSEFAWPLHSHTAHTEEHGCALAIGNALQQLTAHESHVPTRPDLPH